MYITKCESINQIIKDALEAGNHILEVSHTWSEMNEVIYMYKPMTSEVRKRALLYSNLLYYKAEGTPHNKPEEIFYSEWSKIAITFPLLRDFSL